MVAVGGTLPYYYDFGKGYSTTDNITVNDNGTSDQVIAYSVKDGHGCIFTGSVTVLKLNAPASGSITSTPIYCAPAGSTTSTVTVNAAAGTGVGSLSYTIVPSVPVGVVQTGNQFAGLTAGDYTFQVTDANGCFYQELYTVKAVTPIAITGSVTTAISCNAANGTNTNGSASFTVTGVSPASTYKYDVDGGTAVTGQTASTITLPSLAAGTYVVTVTDETTLCTSFASVTLAEPALIAFTANASKVYCSEDISQITSKRGNRRNRPLQLCSSKIRASAPAVSTALFQ